jgi:glycosyltransferase involved in cell wall biosynthesis
MQATTVRWLQSLARHPAVTHVTAITLRAGEHDLPPHVEVRGNGRGPRIVRLWRFYAEVVRALRRGVDCFFVYQGGHYPLLLVPFRLLLGTPIYQWWAHPHLAPAVRLYARFCDTKVFTSTSGAFPLPLPNVRIVGQGIDTDRFRVVPGQARRDRWVTVGRISPVKRIDAMLLALARCNRRFGIRQGLDVYGPIPEGHAAYQERLDAIVRAEGLGTLVTFHGPVRQEDLPGILGQYPVFLHFCDGALDKAAVEAMACGLPVLSTNRCVADVVPDALKPDVILSADDVDAQAEAMYAAHQWDDVRRRRLGEQLRAVVVAHHEVAGLFDRMLTEMAPERPPSRAVFSPAGQENERC